MTRYITDKEEMAIHEEIETCRKVLIEKGYIPIYIALYGAQNYCLNTPDSDIDLKAIVAPNIDDICHGKSDISVTISLPSGGLCDVKTPNKMFECWKKQNVNFMELLFTEWCWVDNEYRDIIRTLRALKEQIAHFNEKAAVNCMLGMAREKQHALCKSYPSQVDIIEKWGYAPKQLHHIKRLGCMLKNYVSGESSYADSLRFEDIEREALIREKTERIYGTPEGAVSVAADWIKEMEEIRDFCVANNILKDKDEDLEKALDNMKAEMIKRSLKAQF